MPEKEKEKIRNGIKSEPKIVEIIAYCIMPNHIHLLLEQIEENGISKYMNNILNSYSRYFNTKYERKGPLWESRFKNVMVLTDEQLIHLTRYIHLNPVTASLVNKPEDWQFSSYKEYIGKIETDKFICKFDDYIDVSPSIYADFVENNIDYQKELAMIKNAIFDE